MTSSHSCAQIAWIFLHIVYRVENIRLKHCYGYSKPLCVAFDYLTVGSDEPEDSVKIPQRKLQHRGRFNEMRDDGEPACGDVREKAAEHMRRVKAT